MANKIQFKRSTTPGATPTLSAGEIGIQLSDKRIFTANDTHVFDAFQNTALSIAISNATGGVLFVGNATYNTVINATHIAIANSTNSVAFTSPTTVQKGGNYYLKADGTWATVSASASPGGSNTYVQFNDSTTLGGSAGFTFDKATNNAFIANSLTVDNLTITGDFTVNTDFITVGNTIVNATINSTSLYIANSTSNGFLTIPSAAAWSATNYFLHANGSWVAVTSGGAPGGGAADVQYANNGAFTGNSGFQYTYSTNNVTIANTLTISTGGTGVNPGSNTLALGNSIGRWVVTANSVATQGFAGNSIALNPTANTILLGNSIGQWVITSNTVSAVSVNTAGIQANATALNPTANTILLGNTIGRWVVTANSVATQGVAANATELSPTANTILLGNSIGQWVITANSINTAGYQGNATALSPKANTILLGNSIGQWVITANSINTTVFVANSTAMKTTVGGNSVTFSGPGVVIANSTGNTITLAAPTTTEKGENRYLKVDGTWSTVTASAAAGGSNTSIQYNDSTAINGSNGFTFDKTTNNVYIANTLTVDGPLVINSDAFAVGSADANTMITATSIVIANSTAVTTIPLANAVQYAATNYYLNANGGWYTVSSGATPGGANTEIQYNVNGTTLGANSLFRYDSSLVDVFVGNTTTTTTPAIICQNSTSISSMTSLSHSAGNSTVTTAPTMVCQNSTSITNTTSLSYLAGNSTVTTVPTVVCQNSITTATLRGADLVAGNSTANVNLTSPNWKAAASKSITILDPINTDSVTIFHTRDALTVSTVRAVVRGSSPSVTFSIYSATDRTATTTTHLAANVCSNTTTGNTLTSFGSTAIAANSFVYLTVTAVSGTVNEFHASVSFGVP